MSSWENDLFTVKIMQETFERNATFYVRNLMGVIYEGTNQIDWRKRMCNVVGKLVFTSDKCLLSCHLWFCVKRVSKILEYTNVPSSNN